MRICVYCASSNKADPVYRAAARRLGELIGQGGHTLVYGGGSGGSMGAVADGALSAHGEVIGVIPRFMADLEWAHPGLTRLEQVETMPERKQRFLQLADALVALPGGCGTLDELFGAITLKRLGVCLQPIVLLDTRGYYQRLDTFMQQVINEHFMNPEHAAMWQRVATPEAVLPAIAAAPAWSAKARAFAVVHG